MTFTWNDVGGNAGYYIWIGTTGVGSNDIYNTAATSPATISGLPTDGSTVYVRLWTNVGSNWFYNDYTYTSGP